MNCGIMHKAPFILLSGVLAAMLMSAPTPGFADSSSPWLAAYYDRFMAICGGQAYEWADNDVPQKSAVGLTHVGAVQVGVGRSNHYALTGSGVLLGWGDNPGAAKQIMDDVKPSTPGVPACSLYATTQASGIWRPKACSVSERV
jgi:hypothetical protein